MENRQPRSPRGRLADPRYRAAMLARLESLIAVLRVAQEKAASAPSANAEHAARLTKMHSNLSRTLEVCDHARLSLHAPQPQGTLPQSAGHPAAGASPEAGCYAESSNFEEYRRLSELGEMPKGGLGAAALDALCRQLTQSD